MIIPVPTNFLQRILRRYNQTELLCRELSEISKIDYEPRVLGKNGNSKIQKMLSRKRRLKNLKNVFSINEKYVGAIRDKVVLLVDDVITTGATANECANVLKSAGAAKVYVATLARVKLQRK